MHRQTVTFLLASLGGAFIVIGVALLSVTTVPLDQGDSKLVSSLLQQLERECDPESPDNNYDWTLNAQPTEHKRGELLKQLNAIGPVSLAEVQACRQREVNTEYHEMLTLVAMTLGDDAALEETARNMAYSTHPAVRLCAARELRKRRDRRMEEWFQLALRDDRSVRNDACGRESHRYYPVRVVAELALKEMGICPEVSNDR